MTIRIFVEVSNCNLQQNPFKMASPDYVLEHRDFMIWFKANYPHLHEKYALNITVPIDKKGVGVSKLNIDTKTYNMLFEIQNEYYLSLNK